MATFGGRLRLLRIEKDLSMAEFAKLLNAGKTTISNWENDNRFPDRDMLIKLADFFGVSLDYLLGRTENRHGVVVETRVDGHDLKYEYDQAGKPEGLSEQEQKRVAELAKELYELMQKQKEEKN